MNMRVIFFSHHEIIVVVFSTDDLTTISTDMFPVESSPDAAYDKMTDELPAAFVAIRLADSEWPSNNMFTIGDDMTATSSNQPLRTGFAYRAFIRAHPLNVCYFTIIYCYHY